MMALFTPPSWLFDPTLWTPLGIREQEVMLGLLRGGPCQEFLPEQAARLLQPSAHIHEGDGFYFCPLKVPVATFGMAGEFQVL